MTIDATGIPPQPAEPVEPSKNSFQRLAGAIFAPAETFADIARKPDILVPLLLLILVSYATTLLSIKHFDFDAMAAQQEEVARKRNPNISDADIERMSRIGAAGAKVSMYIAPLLLAVWYVIMAAVLFGAVRLMGGAGTFKQAFSATLYAWIPLLLLSIISVIVLLARGGLVDPMAMATLVKSNPAFLVDMKEQPVLFALLSSLDVFTIWTVILLIFGFAALSKLSRGKVAAIVLSLWGVMIVIKLGFAALSGGMGS